MLIANPEVFFYTLLLIVNAVVVFIAVSKVYKGRHDGDKNFILQVMGSIFVVGQLAANAALMISHIIRTI